MKHVCRRVSTLSLVLLLSACATGAPAPNVSGQPIQKINPWAHFGSVGGSDTFRFAIVADRTGGHRDAVFEQALRKVNELQPEFVMSVGDLIEGHTEDPAVLDQQWDELAGFIEQLDMPFFYVPGNHDISNKFMEAKWTERFGHPYFHFVYHNVLFLCLDTEDPPTTHMSEAQAAYVAETLAEHKNVRWTLVFMHEPLWEERKDTGWARVEDLLQGRPYTVFAGHHHSYMKSIRHGQKYFRLATTGAASTLRGANYFGEFDHVTWVTMTDEGPQVVNLATEGIRDENVRTPQDEELVRPILFGRAMTVDSVFLEKGARFRAATTTVHLINDTEFPLTIEAKVKVPPELRVDPENIEHTLAAKSSETEKIKLSASKPIDAAELDFFAAEWTAELEPPGRPSFRMNSESKFRIEPVFPCTKRTVSPSVDGRLDDWPALPMIGRELPFSIIATDAWRGPEDLSFGLSAAHDDDWLYLAINVHDDEVDAEKREYHEHVQFLLDARPVGERTAPKPGGKAPSYAALMVTPSNQPNVLTGVGGQSVPEGTRAAAIMNDSGFTAEIAVPASVLDQMQGGRWKDFRLNLVLLDLDPRIDSTKVLEWRPDWNSPMDTSRFGVFERK